MSKTELIDKVAEKTGMTKVAAGEAVNTMLEVITESLSKKEDVAFIGFGTFSVKRREERAGRDPKTGNAIKIEAKNVVKFKVGSQLKASVN